MSFGGWVGGLGKEREGTPPSFFFLYLSNGQKRGRSCFGLFNLPYLGYHRTIGILLERVGLDWVHGRRERETMYGGCLSLLGSGLSFLLLLFCWGLIRWESFGICLWVSEKFFGFLPSLSHSSWVWIRVMEPVLAPSSSRGKRDRESRRDSVEFKRDY